MVTGPLYDSSGGHPALDFLNSVDRTAGKPWVDRLTSYRDLLSWCEQAHTLAPTSAARLASLAASRTDQATAVLARARELREALYRIVRSLVAGEAAAGGDLELVNLELGRALAHARIEPAAEELCWGWALGDELDLLLWPLVRSAAELLTSPDLTLVRRCASETCLWLFLDRTKNHRRRWCDMKVCGNRAKVRRHRRRARDA